MKKSLKNNKLRYFKKETKARDKNLGVLKLLHNFY